MKHQGWTDSLQVSSYLTFPSLSLPCCTEMSQFVTCSGSQTAKEGSRLFLSTPFIQICFSVMSELNQEACVDPSGGWIKLWGWKPQCTAFHLWIKPVKNRTDSGTRQILSQLLNLHHGLSWALAPEEHCSGGERVCELSVSSKTGTEKPRVQQISCRLLMQSRKL